jgi:hypothetical protein
MKNNFLKIFLLIACGFVGSNLTAQHFIGVTGGYGLNTLSSSISGESFGNVGSALNYGLVYKYYSGKWVGIQAGINYTEKGYLNYERELVPDSDKINLIDKSSRRFQMIEVPFVTQFHYELWKLRAIANAGVYGAYLLSAESKAILPDAPLDNYSFNHFDYGLRFGGGIAILLPPIELQFEFNYSVGLGYVYDTYARSNFATYNRLSQMLFSASVFFAL